jgi:hypothetical protein
MLQTLAGARAYGRGTQSAGEVPLARQRQAADAAAPAARARGDVVVLSDDVPAPLSAGTIRDASAAASELATGAPADGTVEALRSDRILAALVMLRLMEADPRQGRSFKTFSIPAPSRAELKEAYRRLSQRLEPRAGDETTDYGAESLRVRLLDHFRMRELPAAEGRQHLS